jgi:hypothetical protein
LFLGYSTRTGLQLAPKARAKAVQKHYENAEPAEHDAYGHQAVSFGAPELFQGGAVYDWHRHVHVAWCYKDLNLFDLSF